MNSIGLKSGEYGGAQMKTKDQNFKNKEELIQENRPREELQKLIFLKRKTKATIALSPHHEKARVRMPSVSVRKGPRSIFWKLISARQSYDGATEIYP